MYDNIPRSFGLKLKPLGWALVEIDNNEVRSTTPLLEVVREQKPSNPHQQHKRRS